jgi:hypothetical protein
MILIEGGNVFKDTAGNPLTRRIAQADVMPTAQWLEKITGLDLTKDKDKRDGKPIRWLGSTGRKADSGDSRHECGCRRNEQRSVGRSVS